MEIIFHGILYLVGYVVLKTFNFGKFDIAPLDWEQGRNGKQMHWWRGITSIYVNPKSRGKKILHPDIASLVGLLVTIIIGLLIYFLYK